jgi:allantoicase/malate synthase/CubicO group peptidase (beta-lactamase class C family)
VAKRDIPYYLDYLSPALYAKLKMESRPVADVPELFEVGESGGLESKDSLKFLCELYDELKVPLKRVLDQRTKDREFIDQRTRACFELNRSLGIDFLDPRYRTVIGEADARGRTVVGPLNAFYCRDGAGKPVAPLPAHLTGNHVTLFGPPDDPKLSVNAMNSYHRTIKNEPAIVEELLKGHTSRPKWGADDEDSKTPLREDLISAGRNLTGCFTGEIGFTDPKTQRKYALEKDHLALPIKRFPGLALPSLFLFYKDNPLPLHLYDFALHLFANWRNPEALAFYVPKLENEEEAAYVHLMMATAEKMIAKLHPEYKAGTIRLFIVLESPRAIFRANEIMDALYPYFAGASLGWHDYLSSTARLFKEDANYRIPVKADPEIVIKYIKASHDLLADVVGSRGGVKIGGMYGVLPMDSELMGASFQVTIKGFIKDVITQMKRDLSGFWVAHPDFVRLGMALVEGWKRRVDGDPSKLDALIASLLDKKYHREIFDFVNGPDIQGLDAGHELYPRALLVADIKESNFIANNHPDEIRYNVFQSLQYLTDWLSGNGCVALPAQIEGVPVRVMDDLATAERSRWEVWHELHHGRFPLDEFLKIAHEELRFIRKDLSDGKKIVQVKWDERTAKWYPIALQLMLQLMTAEKPVEFASELLLPFTVDSIRAAADPWAAARAADPGKYRLDPYIERFDFYFSALGSLPFAHAMAQDLVPDFAKAERLISEFDLTEVIAAAGFHGDIGESGKSLDRTAAGEQALVLGESAAARERLQALGAEYQKKFGVKFLISAKDKPAGEILAALERRLSGSADDELKNAREALWQITAKRLAAKAGVQEKIQQLLKKHGVKGAQIAVTTGESVQTLCFGEAAPGKRVTPETYFELASLSKTLASAYALEYLKSENIPLTAGVNELFSETATDFRLSGEFGDAVELAHLMNHTALNLHYVNGVPANRAMPKIDKFLDGNAEYGYEPVKAIHPPGTVFSYSGGGFLVLEHLLESLERRDIREQTARFCKEFSGITFQQQTLAGHDYAHGFLSDGREVEGTRKMFPAFAAGAMGTAAGMLEFLTALGHAYRDLDGSRGISHDTSVRMLHGMNLSSRAFMGADMGLGVFTLEGGPNRFALHQGANDGFRALFVHAYDGPAAGNGFVILCNADSGGVAFVAETAQLLLREFAFEGIDPARFKSAFDARSLPAEKAVNFGYKEMIFGAFSPALPEAIAERGPEDPLGRFNLAAGAQILEVSNQKFARAENLLSTHLPVFDPELFGSQGKIMDSWETVRHNPKPCDTLVLQLKSPARIRYIALSTQFHLGNQAQFIRLEGMAQGSSEWIELLPKTALEGHALRRARSADSMTMFEKIRVSLYPDGGFTRLGLYDDGLPDAEKKRFAVAASVPFAEKIPQALKPLTPHFQATADEIKRYWNLLRKKRTWNLSGNRTEEEVDFASAGLGGKVIGVTNEHYGPAERIISPFPPVNMFDGFESARSRDRDHREEVHIQLAKPVRVTRVLIDFTYFRNNNPRELSVSGIAAGKSVTLVAKTPVKAFAGNKIEFNVNVAEKIESVTVTAFPDGGMNRVHVFGIIE